MVVTKFIYFVTIFFLFQLENGELFSPLKFTKKEAYLILKEIPIYEESGIMCRIPNWWKKKSNALRLSVSIGDKEPSKVGMDALLAFKPEIFLGEEKSSEEELKKMLLESEGLTLIKGK